MMYGHVWGRRVLNISKVKTEQFQNTTILLEGLIFFFKIQETRFWQSIQQPRQNQTKNLTGKTSIGLETEERRKQQNIWANEQILPKRDMSLRSGTN